MDIICFQISIKINTCTIYSLLGIVLFHTKIKDILNIFHAWVKLNKHLCRQFLFQHQCTRIKTSPVNLYLPIVGCLTKTHKKIDLLREIITRIMMEFYGNFFLDLKKYSYKQR